MIFTNIHRRLGLEKIAQVDAYQQKTQWSCSAGALVAVAKHHGHDITEEEAVKAIGAREGRGAETTDIVEGARKLGLEAWEGSFPTLASAEEVLKAGNPIIADVQSFNYKGKGHYVVIAGYLPGKGFILMDPNTKGKTAVPNWRILSDKEMEKKWWDRAMAPPHELMPKWGVVVTPKKEKTANDPVKEKVALLSPLPIQVPKSGPNAGQAPKPKPAAKAPKPSTPPPAPEPVADKTSPQGTFEGATTAATDAAATTYSTPVSKATMPEASTPDQAGIPEPEKPAPPEWDSQEKPQTASEKITNLLSSPMGKQRVDNAFNTASKAPNGLKTVAMGKIAMVAPMPGNVLSNPNSLLPDPSELSRGAHIRAGKRMRGPGRKDPFDFGMKATLNKKRMYREMDSPLLRSGNGKKLGLDAPVKVASIQMDAFFEELEKTGGDYSSMATLGAIIGSVRGGVKGSVPDKEGETHRVKKFVGGGALGAGLGVLIMAGLNRSAAGKNTLPRKSELKGSSGPALTKARSSWESLKDRLRKMVIRNELNKPKPASVRNSIGKAVMRGIL